jgi:hypothetical protein
LGTKQLIRVMSRSSSSSPLETTGSLRTKSPKAIGLHTKHIRNWQSACKRQSYNKTDYKRENTGFTTTCMSNKKEHLNLQTYDIDWHKKNQVFYSKVCSLKQTSMS